MVITGRIRVSKVYTSTLLDSGASQSFASSTLVMMVWLHMQLISQRVMVALPNAETVFCTKVVKECLLEVEGIPLEADLIVFGIILGMDWL